MSDKTMNQTSDLPDAQGGHLERDPGAVLLNVKEEEEADGMNNHQTEIHWSLPADKDNADIVKVEITEDLCVRRQLEATEEETSDSISPDNADIVKVDVTEDLGHHPGAPNEETRYSISPDKDNADIMKVKITEDLFVRRQLEAPEMETSDSISPGRMDGEEPYICDHMKTEKDEVPINTTEALVILL
ncbi:uncharacterized protein LOC128666922 isoform X2 [Bombina bombina]|uniref:uncharacterized protein LOC128666922 isoform X2 n=1 Tax=Bombina bombina TaxID=8345 RepID=UPI00235AEA95|nr:uncharacterized protein LOC128666922 isoform X2 [Bombina bombina]